MTYKSFTHAKESSGQFLSNVRRLTLHLQKFKLSIDNPVLVSEVNLILKELESIRDLLLQHKSSYSVSLSGKEYIKFCDLIICGTTMAEFLISLPRQYKLVKEHANYWLNLVPNFKPYLEGMLSLVEKK